MESVKTCPGVVNSLGTPPNAKVQEERGPYLSGHPEGYDERTEKVMTTERWGESSKHRMKCSNETRSHGPGDQDLDVILI